MATSYHSNAAGVGRPDAKTGRVKARFFGPRVRPVLVMRAIVIDPDERSRLAQRWAGALRETSACLLR